MPAPGTSRDELRRKLRNKINGHRQNRTKAAHTDAAGSKSDNPARTPLEEAIPDGLPANLRKQLLSKITAEIEKLPADEQAEEAQKAAQVIQKSLGSLKGNPTQAQIASAVSGAAGAVYDNQDDLSDDESMPPLPSS